MGTAVGALPSRCTIYYIARLFMETGVSGEITLPPPHTPNFPQTVHLITIPLQIVWAPSSISASHNLHLLLICTCVTDRRHEHTWSCSLQQTARTVACILEFCVVSDDISADPWCRDKIQKEKLKKWRIFMLIFLRVIHKSKKAHIDITVAVVESWCSCRCWNTKYSLRATPCTTAAHLPPSSSPWKLDGFSLVLCTDRKNKGLLH